MSPGAVLIGVLFLKFHYRPCCTKYLSVSSRVLTFIFNFYYTASGLQPNINKGSSKPWCAFGVSCWTWD